MELREIFIMEAEELMYSIQDEIVSLEANPTDTEIINSIFRKTHTLKGSANLSGYTGIGELSHNMENILDYLRDGSLHMNRDLASVLLQGYDEIRTLLMLIANGDQNPLAATTILNKLQALVGQLQQDHEQQSTFSTELQCSAFGTLPIDTIVQLIQRLVEGNIVWRILMELDEQLFYEDKDPLVLFAQLAEHGSIAHVQFSNRPWGDSYKFDPFKCYMNIEMMFVTQNDVLQEQLAKWVSTTNGSAGRHYLTSLQFQDLLNEIEVSLQQVDSVNDSSDNKFSLIDDQCRAWMQELQTIVQRADCEPPAVIVQQVQVLLQQLCDRLPKQLECRTIILNLLVAITIIRTGIEADHIDLFTPEWWNQFWPMFIGTLPTEHGESTLTLSKDLVLDVWEFCTSTLNVSESVEEHSASTTVAPEAASPSTVVQASKMVRIEAEKLDALMELTGELTIAKDGISYMVRKLQDEYRMTAMAQELREKQLLLERIFKKLQHAIIDVRIPVSIVFSKYQRFIRDISIQLDKQIHFEVIGEDTTIDKNLVESLSEPLLHLVRNAVDHGLESAAERTASSKPATGTITLKAWRAESNVYIEVKDDGRGIDVKKIKQKLLQQAMISPAELSQQSDEQLLQYIFHPGFSTSNEVTELSGRGVGMDAVQRWVESIQGKISVSSVLKVGTTIQLELPMTVKLTEVLQIRVGETMYGLPFDQIDEIVKVPQKELQTLAGNKVTVHRSAVRPIISLKEFMGDITPQPKSSAEHDYACLVFLKNGVGLQVDAFMGKQEIVLKQLDASLRNLTYMLGATIIGDGTVLIVLNGSNIK